MNDNIYKFKDVNFSYFKKFPALCNINLEIRAGEKIAILGANGSGKSSLLQMMDGLIFPDSGEVIFSGNLLEEEILNNAGFNIFFRSSVGLVFQNPEIQLFSPTVFDEIMFGPQQLDLSGIEIIKRTRDMIKFWHLEKLCDRHPYELSVGEKKKVAIASVLAINPDIILLDEPTAGLDPRSTRELIDLLDEMHSIGKTIITSTHDIHIVSELADRIFVLNEEKKIIAEGKSDEILNDQKILMEGNLAHIHKHKHDNVLHAHIHEHSDLHNHEHKIKNEV